MYVCLYIIYFSTYISGCQSKERNSPFAGRISSLTESKASAQRMVTAVVIGNGIYDFPNLALGSCVLCFFNYFILLLVIKL